MKLDHGRGLAARNLFCLMRQHRCCAGILPLKRELWLNFAHLQLCFGSRLCQQVSACRPGGSALLSGDGVGSVLGSLGMMRSAKLEMTQLEAHFTTIDLVWSSAVAAVRISCWAATGIWWEDGARKDLDQNESQNREGLRRTEKDQKEEEKGTTIATMTEGDRDFGRADAGTRNEHHGVVCEDVSSYRSLVPIMSLPYNTCKVCFL